MRGCFRPADEICRAARLRRHRDNLIGATSAHIQQMQKALLQMNLHLHHVISDVTGVTGLAIIRAILAGERDPKELAKLRDYRVKKKKHGGADGSRARPETTGTNISLS